MKIGAIIQARYDSSRLPGKVLMKLPYDSESTVLGQIIHRLALSTKLDSIIIATSDESSDDLISEEAEKLNVGLHRGSKDNVLDRILQAALSDKVDLVVRVTADNPIVWPDILDVCLEKHIAQQADYSRNTGLPYGTSFEIINTDVLKKISALENISSADQEHVTLYIKNHKQDFHIIENHFELNNVLDGVRFTIDYPTDYAMMNILYQAMEKQEGDYTLEDIIEFVNRNSWLKKVNDNNIQKKQFSSLEDEMKEARHILEKYELGRAASILIEALK